MFTPQQIQEISFDKALFKGYDMDSVDEVLEPLTEDYITLYKENSVLKSKMRILVEKLEEYRKQETSMQSAILAAQKTCEQMRIESERKCALMLRQAEEAAAAKTRDASVLSVEEEERLNTAKAATAQFLDSMEKRLKRHMALLEEIRSQELGQTRPEAPAQPAPRPQAAPQEETGRIHQFTPPAETEFVPESQPRTRETRVKETRPRENPRPRPQEKREAFDFEADATPAAAEDKADALIEEIGHKIEESLGSSTFGELAADEPTRKLDDLHGVFSPKKQKIFDELQFGRGSHNGKK